MIQNDFYTSNDISEKDEKFSDDDLFFSDAVDRSIVFDK